jgi:hypothetical protein
VIYILNAPVITNFGSYSFIRISSAEAKALLSDGFVSAVGHEGTARVMSALIGMDIPFNRVAVHMNPGDEAVVLWLINRPEEGRVYSAEELGSIPCELGLLKRIS